MNRERLVFVLLNALGGAAVLGSYWWGLTSHPELTNALWGGVPPWLQPVYTITMLAAAVGYFPFTSYVLVRMLGARQPAADRPAAALVLVLYALILVPSSLWLPLTISYLQAPSTGLWWVIRLDLLAVGAGSVGLLAVLLRSRPARPRTWYVLAVAGMIAFCLQTAVLDAVVWPALFHAA